MPETNKKRVLVIQPIHPAGHALLESRDDVEYVLLDSADEDEIAEAARDVHAITVRTARITRRIIEGAPNLMVVSRHGVGYDAVDLDALNDSGIPLCIALHANMVSVAEQSMAMILALAKDVFTYDAITRQKGWPGRLPTTTFDIENKNLLIVGFGRTGSRVARRAAAFDMKVFAYDPYVDEAVIRAAGVEPVSDYNAALSDMDVVAVHCMKTDETTGMFAAPQFAAMKPSAIIVNCARGGIIDEAALHDALISGGLRGAGLDVFDAEPPDPANPLFGLKNVILSPHMAGVSAESTERMAIQTVDNVFRVFDGRIDTACVVNPEVL